MVHKENKCWCVFRSSKFSSCATQVETTLLFYHDLESYELYDNNDSQVQQELVQKIWKVFKTILEETGKLREETKEGISIAKSIVIILDWNSSLAKGLDICLGHRSKCYKHGSPHPIFQAMELLWLVHMWLSKQDKFLRRTLIAMDHKISYVAPYCVLLLTLDLLSSKRDIGIIVHLEKSVLYLRQNIGMLMIGDGLTSTKYWCQAELKPVHWLPSVPHSNQQHWAERARGWRKRQWAASARVC